MDKAPEPHAEKVACRMTPRTCADRQSSPSKQASGRLALRREHKSAENGLTETFLRDGIALELSCWSYNSINLLNKCSITAESCTYNG